MFSKFTRKPLKIILMIIYRGERAAAAIGGRTVPRIIPAEEQMSDTSSRVAK